MDVHDEIIQRISQLRKTVDDKQNCEQDELKNSQQQSLSQSSKDDNVQNWMIYENIQERIIHQMKNSNSDQSIESQQLSNDDGFESPLDESCSSDSEIYDQQIFSKKIEIRAKKLRAQRNSSINLYDDMQNKKLTLMNEKCSSSTDEFVGSSVQDINSETDDYYKVHEMQEAESNSDESRTNESHEERKTETQCKVQSYYHGRRTTLTRNDVDHWYRNCTCDVPLKRETFNLVRIPKSRVDSDIYIIVEQLMQVVLGIGRKTGEEVCGETKDGDMRLMINEIIEMEEGEYRVWKKRQRPSEEHQPKDKATMKDLN